MHGSVVSRNRVAPGRLRDQSDWSGFSNQRGFPQRGFPTNSVFNHARMGDSHPGAFLPRGAAYCHIGFEGRGPIPIPSLFRPGVALRRQFGTAISKYETSPAPRIRFWPSRTCRKRDLLLHADATSLTRHREISQVGSCFRFSKEREESPKSCVGCSAERACDPRFVGARLRRRFRLRCPLASGHLRRRGS